MASMLQNALDFFRDFGLFDVVLPFLLVFALIFAILEKTKILGIEGKDQPKTNLNTLIAFVIAMLTVATNKVVNTINTALPNIVLIIIAFVAFLLMIGIFFGSEEMDFRKKYPVLTGWFIGVSALILVLILLNSLTLPNGQTWLKWLFEYLIDNFSGTIVTSIIFLIIAVLAVTYIIKKPSEKK